MTTVTKRGRDGLRRSSVTVTLDGTAGKGAIGTVLVFTVTGDIYIEKLVPKVLTSLASAGAATVSLGLTSATASLIGVTGYAGLSVGKFWAGTTPALYLVYVPAAATPPTLRDMAITGNILASVLTADVTAGVIRFDLYWRPLSSDGNVA